MACFIVDDIKHFNVKCSVVFISFLLLLLCPYPHEERQSRGDPGSVPSQNKSWYGMLVVSAQPPFVSPFCHCGFWGIKPGHKVLAHQLSQQLC